MPKNVLSCSSCFLAILSLMGITQSKAADIVWTNSLGGNWSTAANWSPNQVPAGADTAIITNAGSYTVTNSVNATVAALALGGASGLPTLRLTAGTLTITNTIVQTNGVIAITGGTLVTAGVFDSAGVVYETAGSWRLLVPGTVNIYNLTNGELRGATMTVTNFTWAGANIYADAPGDKTIIPGGGVLNMVSDTARVLSYYAGGVGRGIDNFGIWNWSGNCVFTAHPATVNNYGTLNLLNQGIPGTYAQFGNAVATLPTFHNYGTINKLIGTNIFYMGPCNFNNTANVNFQSNTFAMYFGNSTNSGSITVQNGTLLMSNSTITNRGAVNAQNTLLQTVAATLNNAGPIALTGSAVFQTDSGTITFYPSSSFASPGTNSLKINGGTVNVLTTNIAVPSAWIAGGTLYHQTNNTIPTINESAGSWRLLGNQIVSTYNQTNGELRGGTLTVTNCNWMNGNWNADGPGDKTIIAPGGVLNFTTTASRVLSYYAGGFGRGIDNYGTWNWTDNSVLSAYPCAVNNYGVVNVTGAGAPSSYAEFAYVVATRPIWNNYGTFTKSPGTNIFYMASDMNNYGALDVQSGQFILNGSVTTNAAGGLISIASGAQIVAEAGDSVTLSPGSTVTGPAQNALRIDNATVHMRTTNISIPSLLLNHTGASLQQNTNNVIPTINQNGGTWRLNVPATVASYNLTNGELRGANLVVTNFFWQAGSLNSDTTNDSTTVVGQCVMPGSGLRQISTYSTRGRTLNLLGNTIWSGNGLTCFYGTVINNGGTIDVTATTDTRISYGGGIYNQCFFNNTGTFTKSAGTNTIFALQLNYVTNSGAINIQRGRVVFGPVFVQTGGSTFANTNFAIDGFGRIEAGTFTGSGGVAFSFYNNGALNPGASPGLITGTHFTNSASATLNIELGGTIDGTNYDQLRLTGNATLNGNLNVQFVNGFTPVLSNRFTVMTFASRSGTFASITTPPNFEFTPIYTTSNLTLLVTGLTNAPLQIVTTPTNLTVWQPDPILLIGSGSGTTPLTYQWLLNGTNLPNATNVSFSIPVSQPADSGVYTFRVTDANSAQTNASAIVTVIPFNGTIVWTNTVGGNWTIAANWLPNRVPNATNTAVITNSGTYTVTINSPVTVSNIIAGIPGGSGTPSLTVLDTLTLGGSATFETNAVFNLNGTLKTLNSVTEVRGLMNWNSGSINGFGRTIVTNTGRIACNGYNTSKLLVTNMLENYGLITHSPDGGFGPGQLISFSGGARLTNHVGGQVNIVAGNGYDYSGTPPGRSYFVNFGLVNCGGSASVPCGMSVDFINYGTLSGGFCYISRGTNYGTLQFTSSLAELSFFGDEANGEYFTFEPGTVLVGTRPNIDAAGLVRWNAPGTIHNGRLNVGSASGGYSSAGTQFLVPSGYTNTFQVSVARGEFKINAGAIADLRLLSDALGNGFWTYVINNLGTIVADNVSHTSRNFDNRNLLIVRTNFSLTGGSFYGSATGRVVITNGATAQFTGSSIDNQNVDNFGTVIVDAATAFTGSYFENKTNAQLSFAGGTLQTGPASLANYGNISGHGSLAISSTNFGIVTADDTLGRTLTLSDYRQLSGVTDIRRGELGGAVRILGGLLTGTNTVNGSVLNAATVSPGRPFGRLLITGNYTNQTSGLETMPISSTNNYPRIQVSGTAYLAGTLNVTFTNGFFPITGSTYTALTYTARSGAFDQILTSNYEFEILYTPTDLLLRASNALPSVAFSVSGGNTQRVCNPFSLAAAGSDLDGVVTNMDLLMNGDVLASSAGASLTASVELDFPGLNVFVARARDNRGGYGYSTQSVAQVTLSLHVLTLGGVRTNGFKICMTGQNGSNYLMLATTNIAQPSSNWTSLGLMEYTNGIWRHFDSGTITNLNRRFYRALQQ